MKSATILTSFVANVAANTARPLSATVSTRQTVSSLIRNQICSRSFSRQSSLRESVNLEATRGSCSRRDMQMMPRLARGHDVVTAFDKMPSKLPAWWDDEDDDGDDEENLQREEVVDGNDTGALGSLRSSRAKMAMDGSSGTAMSEPIASPGGGGTGGGSGVFNNDGGGGSGRGKGDDGGKSGDKGGESGGDFNSPWYLMPVMLYLRILSRRPLLTKAVTASVLGIIGDALAQLLARRSEFGNDANMSDHDWRRTCAIGLMGILFTGPLLHVWYGLLSKKIVGKWALVKKLLLDQVVCAPIFNLAFSIMLPTLEGEPIKNNIESAKTKLWPVMKANWMLFPPAQLINFALVPLNLQPAFTNVVGLLWNVVITYILHDDDESVKKIAPVKAVTS